MIKFFFTIRLAFPIALLLSLAGNGAVAYAQDDDIQEDVPQANGNVVFQPVYTEEVFNQWVFGNGRDFTQSRKRIDASLDLQMANLGQACDLTDVQKRKLRLAGEGDVKRFMDRYEKARQKFRIVKNDQQKIGEVFQEIQPLQQSLRTGIYGDGSLFSKTISKTLNKEQAAKFETVLRERRRFRYQAKIALVIASLDNAIGLSADQRERFSKLLMDETEAPRKFGQWDYQAVLYQASRLPEAKLKAIFDDAQWHVMSQQIQQAKGMAPFLKNGGFIPDAGDAIENQAIRALVRP